MVALSDLDVMVVVMTMLQVISINEIVERTRVTKQQTKSVSIVELEAEPDLSTLCVPPVAS